MDNVCIICREEMVTGAKRLPCNHIFHTRFGAKRRPFGAAYGVFDKGGMMGSLCFPTAACARGSRGSRRAPRVAWTSSAPPCPLSRPLKLQSRTQRRLRAPRALSPRTVSSPTPQTHTGFPLGCPKAVGLPPVSRLSASRCCLVLDMGFPPAVGRGFGVLGPLRGSDPLPTPLQSHRGCSPRSPRGCSRCGRPWLRSLPSPVLRDPPALRAPPLLQVSLSPILPISYGLGVPPSPSYTPLAPQPLPEPGKAALRVRTVPRLRVLLCPPRGWGCRGRLFLVSGGGFGVRLWGFGPVSSRPPNPTAFRHPPNLHPPPGLPPMPVPPAGFAGLTEEELRAMEGHERQHLEARLQSLHNIHTLLDAAMLQINQYLTVMAAIGCGRGSLGGGWGHRGGWGQVFGSPRGVGVTKRAGVECWGH